ncbi:aldo/keto reductase [Salinarchaeum chitinilyticum]
MASSHIGPIGFGTDGPDGGADTETIATAIDSGYRHIDTALQYESQPKVGAAISRSSVDRDELFVVSKVAHAYDAEITPEYVEASVHSSFEELGVDTIDLMYHHWPGDTDDVETALPVIEEFVDDGRIRHLGVSNYSIEFLQHAQAVVDVPIYANQVECHPFLQQGALLDYQRANDIYLVSYAPLGRGKVFDHPTIRSIAEKYDENPATIAIAWHVARDLDVPIPRSTDEGHVRANLDAATVELDREDVKRINDIDETFRIFDPDDAEL